MAHQAPSEVDTNYDSFVAQLPEILERRRGQYALLHSGRIIGYHGSAIEAATEGYRAFGEGGYSVQEVTDESDSHASSLRDPAFQLGAAIVQVARTGSEDQIAKTREILDDARRRVYTVLGEAGET